MTRSTGTGRAGTGRAGTGLAALGALASAGAIGAWGLQVAPAPFPHFPQASGPAEWVPVREGLPEPVDRWIRAVHGAEVPIIRSVVVTGRARIRPFGVWMPARFRFTHDAGRGYRHYIEATWFGRPFMKVDERYVDGRSLVEIPLVGTDEGPKVEQAANLGMWAELSSAAPSVLVTDPRVSWRPLDALTARLVVPLGEDATDEFVARFDPATGGLDSLEAWRYRSSKDRDRILWTASTVRGPVVGPYRLPATGEATWADQGRPWARFTAEDIRTNVDVDAYLRSRGI